MKNFNCLYYLFLSNLWWCSVLSTESDTAPILHQNERKLWDYLFKNYDTKIRPGNDTEAVVLYFDVVIRHIIELDALTQTFHVQAWTVMEWTDIHMHWNASEFGNIDALRVPSNMVWKPDIMLYNSGEGKEIDHYGDTYVVIYNSGYVLWVPPSTFISLCTVDLQYYPYDEQTCTLRFGSWTQNGLEIDLRTWGTETNETFEMYTHDFFENNEWSLLSIQGKRNVKKYDCCPQTYINLEFIVRIKRRPNLFSLTLILTDILCILTTLCIFFLQPYDGKRLIISIINLAINSLFLLFLCVHLPPTKDAVPVITGSAAATASLTWIALALSVLLKQMTSGTWNIPVPEKIQFIFINRIGNILRLTSDGAQSNAFLYRQMDDTKVLVEENVQGSEETSSTKDKKETEMQNTKKWFTIAIILNRLFLIMYILIIIILISVMIS